MTTIDLRVFFAEPAMLQTVQCPHCGRKLAIDPKHVGTSVVCPLCKRSFTPPGEPDALPLAQPEQEPAGIQRDEPPLRRARPAQTPVSPGRDFAERQGIDVDEEHFESVSGQKSAEHQLADWKEDMPEVPSAYQPSGKLPFGAIASMVIGSLVGAVGSALAFLVVGAIVFALTVGIFALVAWMSETCGRVLCILILLGIGVGVLGGAFTYGLQGWVAAIITTASGVIGKNRNVPAAVSLSIVACILGLVLSAGAIKWFWDALLTWIDPEWSAATWFSWVLMAGEGVGSLIAVVAAGLFARSMVRESKFCEECEEYMLDKTLRGLGLGAAKAATRALAERDFEAAAELMNTPEGKCGVPTLFWCPKCDKGYLEVQAKFKCTWTKGDENEEKEEEWLAASAELEPEHLDLFRERRRKGRDKSDD
jgi:hypothetical protein